MLRDLVRRRGLEGYILQTGQPPGVREAFLTATLGASDDAVWRLLRREGVQLRRRRSWCVSTDPQFAAKPAPGPNRGPPILSVST
jgi:hypothetical protein